MADRVQGRAPEIGVLVQGGPEHGSVLRLKMAANKQLEAGTKETLGDL